MRSPSQCPGTARSATSAGPWLIMSSDDTKFLPRRRVRAPSSPSFTGTLLRTILRFHAFVGSSSSPETQEFKPSPQVGRVACAGPHAHLAAVADPLPRQKLMTLAPSRCGPRSGKWPTTYARKQPNGPRSSAPPTSSSINWGQLTGSGLLCGIAVLVRGGSSLTESESRG